MLDKTESLFLIELNDLNFHAFHGVFEQERRVGNDFSVNVSVSIPISEGIVKDNLDGTISYADIYETVKKEMLIPSDLLENVAFRIGSAIQHKYPSIRGGKVSVRKLAVPIPAFQGTATVTYIFGECTEAHT